MPYQSFSVCLLSHIVSYHIKIIWASLPKQRRNIMVYDRVWYVDVMKKNRHLITKTLLKNLLCEYARRTRVIV